MSVTQSSSSGSDGDRHPASEAHAYPYDLARTVYARWRELLGQTGVRSTELELLEQAISIAYQASLLQEEGRPVTFRVAFAEPDAFCAPLALQPAYIASCSRDDARLTNTNCVAWHRRLPSLGR